MFFEEEFDMSHNRRLDTSYDNFPSGMREYLETYGWHFSKKMCEWAVSKMRRKNAATGKAEPVEYVDKEMVDEILKKNNIRLDNDVAYDATYSFNMARADYLKSSVIDEAHLAMFVKDYLDDEDGYPEIAFTRFYADCIGKGEVILWEEAM